jgi:hypothetical protein
LAALAASAGLFSDSALQSNEDVVIVSFATDARIHRSPRSHLPRIPLRRDQFFCLERSEIDVYGGDKNIEVTGQPIQTAIVPILKRP